MMGAARANHASKKLMPRQPTSSRDHLGRTDIAEASTGECAAGC